MSVELSSHLPSEVLERQATEQRQRIQRSLGALKSSVTELKSSAEDTVRQRLNPTRLARQYRWQLAAGASACALLLGYSVAGVFTRR